jgi:hypothetical protein
MVQDGKPLRQRRRERLERQARERGYLGAWPPRWPKIETAGQFEAVLRKLEAGERRASFVHLLGRRLVALHGELTPDHFRRLAVAVKAVILDEHTFPRVRLRAIQVVSRVQCDALDLLDRRRGGLPPTLDAHLEQCLGAFYGEFTGDDLQECAAVLGELIEKPNPWSQLRAARTMFNLVLRDRVRISGVSLLGRARNRVRLVLFTRPIVGPIIIQEMRAHVQRLLDGTGHAVMGSARPDEKDVQ